MQQFSSSSDQTRSTTASHSAAQDVKAAEGGEREIQDQVQDSNAISYTIQPKLTLGAPNDPLEHEADAIADQVMRMPAPSIQRKCDACEEEEQIQTKRIQRNSNVSNSQSSTSVGGAMSQKIGASKGKGQALPDTTRSFMEPRFGSDFSKVSIHTGSDAIAMNQQLGARAFTTGNDIYFNKGQYNPGSSSGQHLLAHELTHTIQQGGGIRPAIQRNILDEGYKEMKNAAYEAMIQGVKTFKNETFDMIRDWAKELPPQLQGPAETIIGIFEAGVEVMIRFVYAVIGLIVGALEAIVALVEGLLRLVYGLIKYIFLFLKALFGYPDEFVRYSQDIINAIASFPSALMQLLDRWLADFEKASPQRQTIMIGELTGEVLVFIATFGFAAGKAGKIPPASIPLPAGVMMTTSGELVMATRVAAVGVAEPALVGGTTGMAMAMTGDGGSGGGGSGGGGGGSGGGGKKPRDPEPGPMSLDDVDLQSLYDDALRAVDENPGNRSLNPPGDEMAGGTGTAGTAHGPGGVSVEEINLARGANVRGVFSFNVKTRRFSYRGANRANPGRDEVIVQVMRDGSYNIVGGGAGIPSNLQPIFQQRLRELLRALDE